MGSARSATYAEVQESLFALKAGGVKFGVDRMRSLAAALGNPERSVPCVHVAGTNGKGSVAAMVESMARSAGLRVGLYTSPHLVRLGERVQVDRRALTEEEIIGYVAEMRPVADRLAEALGADDRPSFFEFMTAMAFLQFARRRCDLAVIEVGLGGRLDATNVLEPLVSVITSIGLDHCDMLGDTLAAIAREKAGIIKPGRPVVMGRLPEEAAAVVRAVAAERGSPLTSVADVFGEDLSAYPETNLEGDYQRWNAAAAVLAVRQLPASFGVGRAAESGGLARVDWPGRWQRVSIGGRPAVLDASHNPEGAAVLDENLRRLRAETGRPVVAIAAATGAARGRAVLEVLSRHASRIHLVVPHQARSCSHEELLGLLPAPARGLAVPARVEDLFPAPDRCTAGGPGDILLVTGSIYLLGEVLARLEPQRGPGEARLQDF